MTFPKEGVKLSLSNVFGIFSRLQSLLAGDAEYRLIIKEWRETRSLSQNATLHMWFGEISAYLIKRGKSFASPEWVKEALKHTYLGYEMTVRTDVITGEQVEIKTLRSTSSLDTGDMHIFMNKVEAWAAMIGCLVTIPADSEYQQLREQQDA
ncbi:TPA: recombination protein NinB [Klebsiella quasipneumoniae subsp. similipneumoniae]|nr:recombination protein NinB [Klebsiella quasipneumoniae subsp. similipneumoniae]